MPEILSRAAPSLDPSGVVACLCAQWCGSCRDYRAVFETVHEETRWAHLVWIDIEDDADWLDDVEIENFPILFIARGAQVHFFGPMLPHAAQLQRTLDHARADPRPLRSPSGSAAYLAKQLAMQLAREGGKP